jgi:hypothetical protein
VGDDPQATVTMRSRTPGRARTTLLTPSRREGRVAPVEPVVNNPCAFYNAHEAAGATSIRSSLRPLLSRDLGFCKTRARRAAGRRKLALRCHAPLPVSAKASTGRRVQGRAGALAEAASGASSIPEASRASTAVSGILGRPVPPTPKGFGGHDLKAGEALARPASRATTSTKARNRRWSLLFPVIPTISGINRRL